jgi:hypothetical protein
LRRGEQPAAPAANGAAVTLLTTAGVGVLLLVSSALLIWFGSVIPGYGRTIVVIGLLFALLAVPVVVMVVRDFRRSRQ